MSTIQQGRSLAILFDILTERGRQHGMWGEQNLTPEEWLSILGEEYGEVCKAVCEWKLQGKDKKEEYREELIQLAAVAVQMVECLDRHNMEMKNESGKNQGSKIRNQKIPQEG